MSYRPILEEMKARWVEIEEWLRISYTLVAPKKLANEVLEADGLL